jgi:hypothetical protein
MNYQGVAWQEIFLSALHQRRATGFATESGEPTVTGLESYILNSACIHGFSLRLEIRHLRKKRSHTTGVLEMVVTEHSEHNKRRRLFGSIKGKLIRILLEDRNRPGQSRFRARML